MIDKRQIKLSLIQLLLLLIQLLFSISKRLKKFYFEKSSNNQFYYQKKTIRFNKIFFYQITKQISTCNYCNNIIFDTKILLKI